MPTQGESAPFVAEFFQYANGPAVDVTNLKVAVFDVASGTTVLGPTAVGIVHVTTGVYSWVWVIPPNQDTGSYVIVWTATETNATEQTSVLPASTGLGPDAGPCDGWDQPTWTCALTAAEVAVTGVAVQAAADVLFALTGRHLGTCLLTIRPCKRTCGSTDWPFINRWWEWGTYPRPFFFDGTWYNLTCGMCTSGCSCSIVEEALLPAPVAQVLQVKVDGAILAPSAYRVDDWRRLVRVDGGAWPICNDLTKADTEVGTWSVTLTVGSQVSPLGNLALGELATQFAKLIACSDDCSLPRATQQLVRQGVTLNFLDPNVAFADGRLGLYLCDLFITTENPHRLPQASEVYDIDREWYRITNT